MWISSPLHHFPPHTWQSRSHNALTCELPHHRRQRVVAIRVAVSWSVLRPAVGCLRGHASRPSAGWRWLPALASWSPRGFCTFEAKNAGRVKSTAASLPCFQRGLNVHMCLSCLTDFEELTPWMRALLPWAGLWLEPHSGEEYANYSLCWWQYLHGWCKQWNKLSLTSLALAFVNWIQRFWSVCGKSVFFRQDAHHTAVIRQEIHSWWNQFWLLVSFNTSYSKNIAPLFRYIYIYISIFNW